VVVWDESHHATAATFRKVADRYPDALHLGLTATPERADGTALGNVFTKLVAPVGIAELVAAGHLVPCDVVGPPRMLDGLSQDPVEAVLEHAGGAQTVLFAATVGEAEEYARQLTARGVPAASVDGSMPSRRRDDVLARFARRELRVVTNVYVLTEGWDCPEASVCVLARGCGSVATYLQMVGRVLRPAPGKARALLVDLRGVVHQHGAPDEDRAYSLDGKAIREKEARLPLRQCPECGAVAKPRATCGRCGFAFPQPKRKAVEGVAIGAVKGRPRSELIEAWRRLVLIARERKTKDGRPYSPTWAAVRFKEQFGFWPPRDFPRAHEVEAA
jgi:superfamily II DNA or RNA helicase